jgi:hypothetical protein
MHPYLASTRHRLGTLYKRYVRRPYLTLEQFEMARPFTSDNTWQLLSGHCHSLGRSPSILEYGSGVSTYYHLKTLGACGGGKLVSVEHDLDWYRKLVRSFRRAFGVDARREQVPIEAFGVRSRFEYLYRPAHGLTGCGTYQEFQEYVDAPRGRHDLVVVDGRARKACVRHVLEQDLLSDRGLLVLYEAGRGHADWPVPSHRQGTWDYQPEVAEMLRRGGVLVQGSGVDHWPGWTRAGTPTPHFASSYPMEACFLWANQADRPSSLR